MTAGEMGERSRPGPCARRSILYRRWIAFGGRFTGMAERKTLTQVRDLGEFGLIERLAAQLERRLGPALGSVWGIGDDAALWQPTPGWTSVLTTDTMVESVHFTLQTTPWRDLGWKSLAVNISDLAAMAATPRVALVTLGLTGEEALTDIEALYDGIADAAAQYGVRVIGGDTIRAPQVQVGFALTGEAPVVSGAPEVLRRDAARPGDVLAVTGHLGDAAGGLAMLLAGAGEPAALIAAHRRPQPRVAEGRWLLEQGVRCATDNSDGLAREAALLGAASGLAVRIEAAALPLSPALCRALPERAVALALAGGEDYELALAAAPGRFDALRAAWQARFSSPLTAVGTFSPADAARPSVYIVGYEGTPSEFQHFPERRP